MHVLLPFKNFTFIGSSSDLLFQRRSHHMSICNWIVCDSEGEGGVEKDLCSELEAKKLYFWWKYKGFSFSSSLRPCCSSLEIQGVKEPPSATALLLVLFSPLHLDSAFNTLPLWVAYNKLLIYDEAIKNINRKLKSSKKDGIYFGKEPNPMNFVFFLFGAKWSWFFILD